MNDALIRFYEGTGTDDRGRTIDDVWQFSRDDLEEIHDYIQWLFPLTERSAFNPSAPILDAATIERFKADTRLRANLERSLGVMLDFYGLSGGAVAAHWLTPGNHNFLRLTRILKSLSLLGLGDRADQLLERLETVYDTHGQVIGARTMSFWRRAVDRE